MIPYGIDFWNWELTERRKQIRSGVLLLLVRFMMTKNQCGSRNRINHVVVKEIEILEKA